MKVADIVKLDRWRLNLSAKTEAEKLPGAQDLLPEQIRVFNNYFSIGIDAHIALQFHNARNANAEKFTSRTRNLLFYGLEGGKDLVAHKWKDLMDSVRSDNKIFLETNFSEIFLLNRFPGRVVCELQDGTREDLTERLQNYGAHAVLFLNINSYSGGTKPWKQSSQRTQSTSDKLVEIIALDNVDLALLHMGGTGECLCQARSVELVTTRAVPVQVDGEPVLLNPFRLKIQLGLYAYQEENLL